MRRWFRAKQQLFLDVLQLLPIFLRVRLVPENVIAIISLVEYVNKVFLTLFVIFAEIFFSRGLLFSLSGDIDLGFFF